MKNLIFITAALFSTASMANNYCESRGTVRAVSQCYETLTQNESLKLKRIYADFNSHPSITPEALQQMEYDHQNWAGMMDASCQDYRCTYTALVNRNNALTSRLKALGPVQAADPVQQVAPAVQQPSQNGPSFNCAKASTNVEHLICNSATVSGLDTDLSDTYKEALSMTADNKWIKDEQVEWNKNVRNSCQDEACLIKAYEERIDELFWTKKHMGMEQ